MSNALTEEYAQVLAALEGNDFQVEVCTRLRGVILDFQDVPSKPHGDAGLDAFSHGGERGYCCYGPEHNAFKTNTKRESGIVDKFSADLRRLFELDTRKSQLIRIGNLEMATILPQGRRIKHIKLIVNWFESHRILGKLLTRLAEYKAASACRYVHPDASVVVIGPKQLAEDYAVDEFTIARARQHSFMQRVHQSADTLTIEDPKDFEWKMRLLLELRPDQADAVRNIGDTLRGDWRTALAFERELGDAVPALHQALELARGQILTRVAGLMLSSTEPWTQLGSALDVAKGILLEAFGVLYGQLIPSVASGEVARLIGECTIGWRKAIVTNG